MRVSWNQLSGDQAEDLIAVLLLREHTNGTHVRAHRGDGGIDIFIPTEAPMVGENYQVKNFSHEIGKSQKDQIRSSLHAAKKTSDSGKPKITKIYITVPLNPSRDEIAWLDRFATRHIGIPTEFFGLSHIEGLAAKYPEVVDYYIHGGKMRADDAVASVTNLLRETWKTSDPATANTPLQPADIVNHLGELITTVNSADPFFRYEISIGQRPPVEVQFDEQAATVVIPAADGSAVVISIVPRFKGAQKFRDISRLNLNPRFTSEEEREQFEDFQRFGAPAVFTADYSMELPGGIHSSGSNQIISVSSLLRGPEESRSMRLQLLNAEHEVIYEGIARVQNAGVGSTGQNHYFSLVGESGCYQIELRLDREDSQLHLSLSVLDISTLIAVDIKDEMKFLAKVGPAKYLSFSLPYGPTSRRLEDISSWSDVDQYEQLYSLVSDLADIQNLTNKPVRVPTLGTVDRGLRDEISNLASLARDEDVAIVWSEARIDLWPGVEPDPPGTPIKIASVQKLTLNFDEDTYDLGYVTIEYNLAEMQSSSTADDGHLVAMYVPSGDATATMRRYLGELPE
jgi:hypothetical protein